MEMKFQYVLLIKMSLISRDPKCENLNKVLVLAMKTLSKLQHIHYFNRIRDAKDLDVFFQLLLHRNPVFHITCIISLPMHNIQLFM